MTYEDIINNIRDLGFSSDDEMTDFGLPTDGEMIAENTVLYTSINRAMSEIGDAVAPCVGKFEFEVVDEGEGDVLAEPPKYEFESGIIYFDMKANADGFITMADETPIVYSEPTVTADGVVVYKPTYKKFNDFEIDNETTLVFDSLPKGKYRLYYKKLPTQLTYESNFKAECELPLKVHHLIPLLASYYLWLDDEPTKAQMYKTQFEQNVQIVASKDAKPRMRILSGGI